MRVKNGNSLFDNIGFFPYVSTDTSHITQIKQIVL